MAAQRVEVLSKPDAGMEPFCFKKDCILHGVKVHPDCRVINVRSKQMSFARVFFTSGEGVTVKWCHECHQARTRIILPAEKRIITLS